MDISSLLGELRRSWRQHLGIQVSTLFVLSATFAVMFSLFSLLVNLKGVLTKWGKDIQVTVFLEEDLPQEQVGIIESSLREMGGFQQIKYVSKEEARTRFVRQVPGFAQDVVSDPDFSNPFPASFQVGGLSQAQLSGLSDLARKVSDIIGVEDVAYGQEWVENYAGFINGISRSGVFVLLTLLLGSLFVISNSIRVALQQRREEVEILELVGATQTMVRAPFVFEGAVMGGLAAIIGIAASYGVFIVEMKIVNSEMGFLGVGEVWTFFNISSVLSLVLLGVLSGASAAYFCVRRMNDGWSAMRSGVRD